MHILTLRSPLLLPFLESSICSSDSQSSFPTPGLQLTASSVKLIVCWPQGGLKAGVTNSPWVTHAPKGSPSLPLSMNFWKSSKRPLTPPLPPFFGKNVAIFCYEIFWNGNDPPKLASLMLKILQRNFLDRK